MLGDEGYFDMPLSVSEYCQEGGAVILLHETLGDSLPPDVLQQAAELLGLSAGSLKRVCRKLGLARWPFRVRKSLRAVIAKTEEFMVRPCGVRAADFGHCLELVLTAGPCRMMQRPGTPSSRCYSLSGLKWKT